MYTLADMFQLMYTLAENQLMYYRLDCIDPIQAPACLGWLHLICTYQEREKNVPICCDTPKEPKIPGGFLRVCRLFCRFYRTRVRSLHCLPLSLTHWLTDSLTHSVTFSKLDWCDPGVWRYLFKTWWGCYYCWCWFCKMCWQGFGSDLEAEVWS